MERKLESLAWTSTCAAEEDKPIRRRRKNSTTQKGRGRKKGGGRRYKGHGRCETGLKRILNRGMNAWFKEAHMANRGNEGTAGCFWGNLGHNGVLHRGSGETNWLFGSWAHLSQQGDLLETALRQNDEPTCTVLRRMVA